MCSQEHLVSLGKLLAFWSSYFSKKDLIVFPRGVELRYEIHASN